MAETVSTYVVEFGEDAAAIPEYKLYSDPASPAEGEKFRVIAEAPFALTLDSPYGSTPAKGAAASETRTAQISFGGNTEASADAPIARIISAVAITPLISAVTGDIVVRANNAAPLAAPLGRALYRPALDSPDSSTEPVELYGTVEIEYQSHPLQVWQFPGFEAAGEYVFLATADLLSEPAAVTVSVGGESETAPVYAVEIEPSSPSVGQAFTISILSAAAFSLSSPYGDALTKTTGTAANRAETVSFGGNAEASGAAPIAVLLSVSPATPLIGTDGKSVSLAAAGIKLEEGKLLAKQPLYGSVEIEYRSFPPQQWGLSGRDPAGEYLFFASADILPEPEPVTVTVSEPGEKEGSYQWSNEADGNTKDSKLVYLTVVPWRDITLTSSVGGHASISYQGVQIDTVTEQIEIVGGVGSVPGAAYEVLSTSWPYDDLGAVTIGDGGAIATATPGNALLEIEYRVRKHKWRVSADIPKVQLIAEG
jgi:hypothetical protein